MAFESCPFIFVTKALHLEQAFFVEASGIPHVGFAHMHVCIRKICIEHDQYGIIVSVAAQLEWR